MTTSRPSLDYSTRFALPRATHPKPRGKTTTGSSTAPKPNLRTTSKPTAQCAVVVLHVDDYGVYQPEVVWWDDDWRDVEWDCLPQSLCQGLCRFCAKRKQRANKQAMTQQRVSEFVERNAASDLNKICAQRKPTYTFCKPKRRPL